MKNVDIYGLVIITLFTGGFFTFLGLVIKTQNAGDMLNGFDSEKYDKEKVSMIVGQDMLNTGLLIILLGILGIFLNSRFYNFISFSQNIILILGIIKSMYDMNKRCKIEK